MLYEHLSSTVMNTFYFDEHSFYFHTGCKRNIYIAKDVLFSVHVAISVLMQANFHLFIGKDLVSTWYRTV